MTLVVADYDEAIAFYTNVLGFKLVTDEALDGDGDSADKRWVVVSPSGSQHGCDLLLARAAGSDQRECIGAQTGGRVGFFLHTEDFRGDYERMQRLGVSFLETPRDEPYGTVVVFQDLYGNRWDLLQPK